MAHLKPVYPYLVVLFETLEDVVLRKRLLNKAQVLRCLSEIAHNILKNNIELSSKDLKKLKKYKKIYV